MSFNNKFTVTDEFAKSNVYSYAIREFDAMFPNSSDDTMQVSVLQCVIDLLQEFHKQGHSGMSSSYVSHIFGKLAAYEPLCALTGEDSEWTRLGYSDDMMFQNKRCPHVFKGKDGAYDSSFYVFEDPNGSRVTNGQSRKYIQFPYTPETVIVYRDEAGNPMWDTTEE